MLHDKSIKLDQLTLGVCYYPEHWKEELWADDLKRMLEHGITVARVFEFAWTVVEKEEGVFDFALFDRFLDLAHRMKMQVIMCTPTATPPVWLTHKYPEALNATKEGDLYYHGHRRHYNYNSREYNRLSARIVTKLAERYGDHPAVIGWQIDNEINCEIAEFYSEADHAAFRDWLKKRFGTLDKLNEAIGAAFWNQTYTDWAQVSLEKKTLHGHGNPHLALLEKRFTSHSARAFVKMQADILHKHVKGRFVTTNGIFGHLDNHEMTQEGLDFLTYDSYPNFAYGQEAGINAGDTGSLKDRAWGLSLSRARSISPNFGVMEQQSGPGGWDYRMLMPMPKPGQMQLWTMQSVAHGADFISYFRWRTCWVGTEIYWHGLNDYSNRPNRRLEELKGISALFEAAGAAAGGRYEARVGILTDYLNEWDGERDLWHGPLDAQSRQAIFRAAQLSHTPVDLVYLRETASHQTTVEELAPYSALFYPHPTILTQRTAQVLKDYVAQGGKLVFGARTGYKDEYGRCPMVPMPGFAADICDVEVVEYTLARFDEPVLNIRMGDQLAPAPDAHDVLQPGSTARVLAQFDSGWYGGRPALTRKDYEGGGVAYYLGSGFSFEMADLLLKEMGVRSPYAQELTCPQEVEVAVRRKDGEAFLFLLNYTEQAQACDIHGDWRLLDGSSAKGSQSLPPFGVLVLRKEG